MKSPENDLLSTELAMTQAQHSSVLKRQLWAIADLLRGQMDSSEYSKYMLSLIFYKFLSEYLETQLLTEVYTDYKTYEELCENETNATEDIIEEFGYFIKPEYLYKNIVKEIHKGQLGKWNNDYLKTALNKLEESPVEQKAKEAFEGLFDDMDLDSKKLGLDIQSRNNKMAEVILEIAKIDFHLKDTKIDVLGDAYEYLIGNFASEAGKKGGEFYTPQQVSLLVAQILTYEKPNLESVYDPTCGSGSLLLQIVKHAKSVSKYIKIFGQELNTSTSTIAKMNMIMHGHKYDQFTIKNNNTLTNDEFTNTYFDAIGANPPYSAKWKHTTELETDSRFVSSGRLAPKDKADFAFVQHCWHHLNDEGVASIVLPHGVLFRGGAEGAIREWLIKENAIHTIIGLPEKLFFGTGIPTIIIVLKKGREADDGILFIDASQNFSKGKNQNHLDDSHLEEIMSAYKNRESVDKFAHLSDNKELKKNDYNLNITRYVDTSEDEIIIDLDEVSLNIQETEEKILQLNSEISNMINQLVPVDSIPVIKREEIIDDENNTIESSPENTTLF